MRCFIFFSIQSLRTFAEAFEILALSTLHVLSSEISQIIMFTFQVICSHSEKDWPIDICLFNERRKKILSFIFHRDLLLISLLEETNWYLFRTLLTGLFLSAWFRERSFLAQVGCLYGTSFLQWYFCIIIIIYDENDNDLFSIKKKTLQFMAKNKRQSHNLWIPVESYKKIFGW